MRTSFGYTIERQLGSGGYGDVSLVWLNDNRQAAMKVIDTTKAHGDVIKMEYKTQTLLSNGEHIVKMLKRKVEGTNMLFFLEYMPGGSLDQHIPYAGMEPERARGYSEQLLNGLAYIHEHKVVHMDIKPGNLLLDEYGVLKISDFGLARFFELADGSEVKVHAHCGTVPFSAPEVWSQKYVDGPPTDIWSVGVTIIAMLIGGIPWRKANVKKDHKYATWRELLDGNMRHGKIPDSAMALLQSIFIEDADERATMEECQGSRWIEEKDFGDKGDKEDNDVVNIEAIHESEDVSYVDVEAVDDENAAESEEVSYVDMEAVSEENAAKSTIPAAEDSEEDVDVENVNDEIPAKPTIPLNRLFEFLGLEVDVPEEEEVDPEEPLLLMRFFNAIFKAGAPKSLVVASEEVAENQEASYADVEEVSKKVKPFTTSGLDLLAALAENEEFQIPKSLEVDSEILVEEDSDVVILQEIPNVPLRPLYYSRSQKQQDEIQIIYENVKLPESIENSDDDIEIIFEGIASGNRNEVPAKKRRLA